MTKQKYEDYCKNQPYATAPAMAKVPTVNCSDFYNQPQSVDCQNNKGNPVPKYDTNGCQVFDKCDYCSRDFDSARNLYNRNIFFILAPLGLIIVIIGIYVVIDYIGAGLMFGGLITMFYATVRYFTDMSKMLRALVILIELLIIIWIAYKKIGDSRKESVKQKKTKK